ncbi:MAG: efflux RND transporter periplasmic adaptor subunit [Syntrophothermus sp.]
MDNKNVGRGRKALYWITGLIIVALIAGFAYTRLNRARARSFRSAQNATAQVTTSKVISLDLTENVQASGSLEAQPSASLTWNTGGVVDAVTVKAGDQIKVGEVLMKLKTSSVDASIISAQSDLVTAQKNLQDVINSSDTSLAQAAVDLKTAQVAYDKAEKYLNYLQSSDKVPQTNVNAYTETKSNSWMYVYKTKLYKGPAPQEWIVTAQNDLALKKAQLADAQRTYDYYKNGTSAQDVTAAQAKVDAAQATVDTMSIIAPFDGEVLYTESQPGDVVTTGTSAVDIANLDHLYIDAQVDESDIANVQVGAPITATLDAMPGLQLTGQVAAINPVGAKNSGLVKYTVRIAVDKVAGDTFLPLGATANVTIQVQPVVTALGVPTSFVKNDSQGEHVLVVQPGEAPRRVDVVSSTIVGDHVVVTGDLKVGDVLTMGQRGNGTPGAALSGGN